jgi:hypothetical protein
MLLITCLRQKQVGEHSSKGEMVAECLAFVDVNVPCRAQNRNIKAGLLLSQRRFERRLRVVVV